MSSPSSPIDDGTPMNAPARASTTTEHNGDPGHLVNGSPPPCSDDNPDNDQPQERRSGRRPNATNDSLPPPASPMHQDGDEDPGAPGGAAGEDAADARGQDKLDALPKLFRPLGASSTGDGDTGKRSKGSVEAWSATDVYALPPVYPSMGKFVIISNKNFDANTGMGVRTGTDVDAENLYLRFKEFGFDVDVKRNLKAKDIRDLFQGIARMDHSSYASFGCAILTHGEDGVVYGTNGPIEIDQITKPFKGDRCKSLVGKPKVFFIQACRGTDLMDGTNVDPHQHDANSDIAERLPVESDFLMAYSVVPGYFSWRNSIRGSWFIQALCECLDKYGRSMDLLRLMTRVNKKVALDFESNTNNREMHKKKQIPCITSMMTKDFYLDSRAVPNDDSP